MRSPIPEKLICSVYIKVNIGTKILRPRGNTNCAHSAHKPERELLCLRILVISGEMVNSLYNLVKGGQVDCPSTELASITRNTTNLRDIPSLTNTLPRSLLITTWMKLRNSLLNSCSLTSSSVPSTGCAIAANNPSRSSVRMVFRISNISD